MDWNTTKGRTALSASLVVLLGAVLVIYQFAAKHIWGASLDLTKFLGIDIGQAEGVRGAGPQSPIRVVGGSIKLKVLGTTGWTSTMNQMQCAAAFRVPFNTAPMSQTITSCIVSPAGVDFSSLTLAGVNMTTTSQTWTTVGMTGLGADWTLTAYARGTGVSPPSKGVDICVFVSGACVPPGGSAANPSPIAIASFDNTSGTTSLATLKGEGVESSSDTTLFGYHDPNYNPAAASPGTAATLLQYMGQLTVTTGGIPTNYNCFEGFCQMFIGN
jgi:hypothetical protein